MLALNNPTVALYVDKLTRSWIVRDPDGNFWIMPSVDSPWENREPFDLQEGSDLEPIPGHYKYMFDLPF
ncbi:MAG: hypothetical protein U1D30_20495 [Planctomycetota bacterium]